MIKKKEIIGTMRKREINKYRNLIPLDKLIGWFISFLFGCVICLGITILCTGCKGSKKVIKDNTVHIINTKDEAAKNRVDSITHIIYIKDSVYVCERDCTYLDSAGVVRRDRYKNEYRTNKYNQDKETKKIDSMFVSVEKNDSLTSIKEKEVIETRKSSGFYNGFIIGISLVSLVIIFVVSKMLRSKES